MRIPPFIAGLLAVLGTVAGGSLECTPAKQAWEQHRGAELYGRMCAVCHDKNGQGYKADQAPAIGHSDYLATASDTFLNRAINDGRATTTMSAWGFDHGGPLKPRDVEATIAYLRTWQNGPSVELDERPVHGDTQKGALLYARECTKCHGAKGTGGQYLGIGGAQLLATASDGFLRYAIAHGRPGTAMPAFETALDADAIENIVALLRDWQKTGPAPATQRATPAHPPPIPLGPVPLNPKGPEPIGFQTQPQTTKAEVIKRELDRGAKMAFLDARAPSDYSNDHIAGAVSVPFYDPDQYFADLPKDAWLVCYCSCPHAESGQLASKLVAHGFKKVTVLDEGLGFWRNKGYGTHNGIDP
jgi:cytochrome c oxidase cbb3-type subunit 3